MIRVSSLLNAIANSAICSIAGFKGVPLRRRRQPMEAALPSADVDSRHARQTADPGNERALFGQIEPYTIPYERSKPKRAGNPRSRFQHRGLLLDANFDGRKSIHARARPPCQARTRSSFRKNPATRITAFAIAAAHDNTDPGSNRDTAPYSITSCRPYLPRLTAARPHLTVNSNSSICRARRSDASARTGLSNGMECKCRRESQGLYWIGKRREGAADGPVGLRQNTPPRSNARFACYDDRGPASRESRYPAGSLIAAFAACHNASFAAGSRSTRPA